MLPRLLLEEAAHRLADTDPRKGDPALVGINRSQARYLARVLRLGAGDPLQVFDGQGGRYRARIVQIDGEAGQVRLEQALPPAPSPRLQLTLAQCLSSAEKMDWTIEKAVELGVCAIVPLFSERSLIRLDQQRGMRKLEHWRAIVEAACMQCGQDRLPTLSVPVKIAQWLETMSREGLRLVLSPTADASLVEVIERIEPLPTGTQSRSVTLLVGPESGLSPAELERLAGAGFVAVTLGPRVLRTETAGLAALAAIAALAGDFR
jgi:16S rRNA (uracil1498-N3)-methyltransferase